MKKLVYSLLILTSSYSFAQSILNAKSPEEFRKLREENKTQKGDKIVSVENTPLPYGYIDEKDILKSIVVWEIIDMNERLNQPFYHNSDGLVQQNRSLYQILLDGINSGKIKEVYDDEMFTTKLNPTQIQERLSRVQLTDELLSKINAGEKVSEQERKANTDIFETKSENVKLLKIKGMWYIDKRDAQMKYRLLGIAAMGPDPQTMGVVGPDGQPIAQGDELIDLFWVYYPDARPLLANSIVFNNKNLSSDITFDDILNARRFSSIIYKSDNGMGTGVIKDYIPRDAEAQLEESDRIKNQILEMENSLWNY
ncbi:gliding motility protein GldN [Elizabethkingia sp. JS20170427COW]|uniref:type IX secretion system ring protein PorN/GldN n=1 Tax=Elizabethkingia sp. JS20170427COW TaxID=2583851 RepID=UPI0011103D9B|nr:gliding motility protein GldN [Elizabethkingia sp. JS20170427COW]QCX53560.1 gliding motility protein GldN [Elizabethkingia sp. JS20170427COW]